MVTSPILEKRCLRGYVTHPKSRSQHVTVLGFKPQALTVHVVLLLSETPTVWRGPWSGGTREGFLKEVASRPSSKGSVQRKKEGAWGRLERDRQEWAVPS